MKKISTCALLVALASFTTSLEAAYFRVETRITGSSWVHSIYLDFLTEAEQVAALSVSILPEDGTFENYSETGFGPAPDFRQLDADDDATFTNAVLSLPPVPFNGKFWTIIDGSDEVAPPSGPAGIGYAASSPGSFLTADNLLLNNIMLPRNADVVAMVDLIGGDGKPVQQFCFSTSGPYGECIPEPNAFALTILVMIGFIAQRRHI